MAHSLSTKKRIRQNLKRQLRNRTKISRLRTMLKKTKIALEENDLENSKIYLPQTIILLDKAVTSGLIHRNNAANKKSKITRHFNKLVKTENKA